MDSRFATTMIRWGLAILGFVYGRFWGALLGYALGLMIEQARKRPRIEPGRRIHYDVLRNLVTLSMAVARADGRLERAEIRAIRRLFESTLGFRGRQIDWLQEALKTERKQPQDWREAAQSLGRMLHPGERFLLLRILIQVAAADGHFDGAEQQLLAEIGGMWGIGFVDPGATGGFGGATPGGGPVSGKDRRWALNVMGLDEQASGEEIERAYKRLARERHPDRFEHLGEEFAKEAHEQFVELQEAYRILKEGR